jgi:hypothetical protein
MGQPPERAQTMMGGRVTPETVSQRIKVWCGGVAGLCHAQAFRAASHRQDPTRRTEGAQTNPLRNPKIVLASRISDGAPSRVILSCPHGRDIGKHQFRVWRTDLVSPVVGAWRSMLWRSNSSSQQRLKESHMRINAACSSQTVPIWFKVELRQFVPSVRMISNFLSAGH